MTQLLEMVVVAAAVAAAVAVTVEAEKEVAEKEVVGMDFVELSPNGQFHAEMTAAQLVYHAIGLKGLQAGWLSREVDHI